MTKYFKISTIVMIIVLLTLSAVFADKNDTIQASNEGAVPSIKTAKPKMKTVNCKCKTPVDPSKPLKCKCKIPDIPPTPACELVPVYRYYMPSSEDHLVTLSQEEMAGNDAYVYEGISFYACKP